MTTGLGGGGGAHKLTWRHVICMLLVLVLLPPCERVKTAPWCWGGGGGGGGGEGGGGGWGGVGGGGGVVGGGCWGGPKLQT